MNHPLEKDPVLVDALKAVSDFIQQVTGVAPTPAEVADAYVATRLSGERGRFAGAIGETEVTGIFARIAPPDQPAA